MFPVIIDTTKCCSPSVQQRCSVSRHLLLITASPVAHLPQNEPPHTHTHCGYLSLSNAHIKCKRNVIWTKYSTHTHTHAGTRSGKFKRQTTLKLLSKPCHHSIDPAGYTTAERSLGPLLPHQTHISFCEYSAVIPRKARRHAVHINPGHSRLFVENHLKTSLMYLKLVTSSILGPHRMRLVMS